MRSNKRITPSKRSNQLISIVTNCFNEEGSIEKLYLMVKDVMKSSGYKYEHIFIDNSSTDSSIEILRKIAAKDKALKVIINARNFGVIRSPYYGILQSNGDACVLMSSDLQDPPALINNFIDEWEKGFKIVLAQKYKSEESKIKFHIRKIYYGFMKKISDVPIIENVTGFGLFDRDVVNILRKIKDPYPYLRGLLLEIGYPVSLIPYSQPKRLHGKSSYNFYILYDYFMLGITQHSKVPLRIITIFGFFISFLSFFIALYFLFVKLFFWNDFELGTSPILIGIFFFGSLQAFFIGIIGEYISSINTRVKNVPLVVESERINF